MTTDGSYEIEQQTYASIEEAKAVREAMAARVPDRDIGHHGNASFNDGMPPDTEMCSVLSPMALKVAVEADGLALIQTPMRQLQVDLEACHGPSKGMNLTADHGKVAQPSAENVASMSVDNGFKLEPDTLEPKPPTGSSSS